MDDFDGLRIVEFNELQTPRVPRCFGIFDIYAGRAMSITGDPCVSGECDVLYFNEKGFGYAQAGGKGGDDDDGGFAVALHNHVPRQGALIELQVCS